MSEHPEPQVGIEDTADILARSTAPDPSDPEVTDPDDPSYVEPAANAYRPR